MAEGWGGRGVWEKRGAPRELPTPGTGGPEHKGTAGLGDTGVQGWRGASTRVPLSAECHGTTELCETPGGETTAGMNSASAGLSQAAAPSSWPRGHYTMRFGGLGSLGGLCSATRSCPGGRSGVKIQALPPRFPFTFWF